jgi:hypothetical protein
MRQPILSPNEQRDIKPFKDEKQYNQIAIEVEDLELIKLLGVELVFELQNNPTSTDNAKLLNGCDFTNAAGRTVSHKGIKYILAYFNFSKYLDVSAVTDTATGFVNKTRVDAETISEGKLKRLQENARALALSAWEMTEEFIVLNSSKYPAYYACRHNKVYMPKFNNIRRTNYGSFASRGYTDPVHRIV